MLRLLAARRARSGQLSRCSRDAGSFGSENGSGRGRKPSELLAGMRSHRAL